MRMPVEDVVPPGSSGVVAVLEEIWVDEVEKQLAKADKKACKAVDKQTANELKNSRRVSHRPRSRRRPGRYKASPGDRRCPPRKHVFLNRSFPAARPRLPPDGPSPALSHESGA
jgi:hypothetical protein